MNKFLLGASALAAVAFAGSAHAETYVGASVGLTNAEVAGFNLEQGTNVEAHVGKSMGPLRFEAGLGHTNLDSNFFGLTLPINATQFTGMAFYDIGDGAVRPYVGGGLTYTRANVDVFSTNIEGDGLGWQVATGVRTPVNDHLDLNAGVTYGETSLDMKVNGFKLGSVDTNETTFRVGVDFIL